MNGSGDTRVARMKIHRVGSRLYISSPNQPRQTVVTVANVYRIWIKQIVKAR